MYCFKYCSPGDRQFGMLSRGEVFFASADELNDGSECRPHYVLKGSQDLWYRLCENILVESWLQMTPDGQPPGPLPAELVALTQPLSCAITKSVGRQDLDYDRFWPLLLEKLGELVKGQNLGVSVAGLKNSLRRVRVRMRELLHEHVYLASFSRNPRDPTMWGHYGGAERGFCIVLRAPEKMLRLESPAKLLHGTRPSPRHPGVLEIGIYNDADVALEPVTYQAAPPRVNAFHRLVYHFPYSEAEHDYDVPLHLAGKVPDRQERLLGLVKAPTWRYEQEVRAFLPNHNDLTPEARCFRLSWRHVQGVIFGPKMSNAHRERTIIACHLLRAGRENSDAREDPFVFLEAQQQRNTFQMFLVPIGVLQGHYGAHLMPFLALEKADKTTTEAVRHVMNEIQAVPVERRPKGKRER